MNKTLGIDLGSNSLGWAVLDETLKQVSAQGVVIFPECIGIDNKPTETPAATRRKYRMARRLKFRRKARKWKLLGILIREKMCPLTLAELDAWKTKGIYPLANKAFLGWLKATDTSNPYCDRARAAEVKVPLETLGRALYHIAQRRGFKSSRKEAPPDTGDEDENKKLMEKAQGVVESGIAELSAAIEKSGAKTLGQYFFRLLEEDRNSPEKRRVRKHYTHRVEHYEKEFAVIMDCQGIPSGSTLRKDLYSALFMQRPLRSQRHLVGMCPLEPQSPRTFAGHPLFEEFRMWAFVNNLKFESPTGEEMPLTPEDRARVAGAFDYGKTTFKFKRITDFFKKDDRFKDYGWNKPEGWHFHHYKDAETLPSRSVGYRLRKYFGSIPYDEQQVVNALMFYEDVDRLIGWLKKHYPALDDAAAKLLASIRPSEATAQYSLKAIKRIVPFLRKGYQLYDATLLAKLPDFIADFDSHEDEICRNLLEIRHRQKEAREAAYSTGEKVVPFLDVFQDYLLTHWGVTEDQFKQLYVLRDSPYKTEKEGRIPAVQLGMLRNPLVQRALTTLRRLVNYLHDHGTIDEDTAIHVEMARSVNNYATRVAWQLWQKKRQEAREEARKTIEEHGCKVTEDAIERCLLWREQDGKCLYTGKSIGIEELLGGNAFDVEHTIPRSKSGDDSLANKTICEARYNRDVKKGRIPQECPNCAEIETRLRPWRENASRLEKDFLSQKAKSKGNPEARAKALAVKFELDYWRDKLRRFEITADKLTNPREGLSKFKNRQLVDTGIMTKHAKALLETVYPRVLMVNGAATAFARKAWGLQPADEAKDRTNHVHHAKDAMVIAALTRARFNAICTALKDDAHAPKRECDVCPAPWDRFADDVRTAAETILIKHVLRRTTLKQSSKQTVLAKPHPDQKHPGRIVKYVHAKGDTVRGPLHKETFYGCIQKPGEDKKSYVVRKSLIGPLNDALKTAKDIVDPAVRDLVKEQLAALKSQNETNVEPGMIKMPSGVPVNKVRVIKGDVKNPQRLRVHAMSSRHDYKTFYYVTVAERSNFRMGVYDNDGKLSVVPDNSLEWAQNHKKTGYKTLDKRPGFIGFVYPGSLALTHATGNAEELHNLPPSELAKRLYKVRNIEGSGRLTLCLHTEARASTQLSADIKEANNHLAPGEMKKSPTGESKIDLKHPHELLRVSSGTYLKQMMFEGIHFKMMLDGTIRFL